MVMVVVVVVMAGLVVVKLVMVDMEVPIMTVVLPALQTPPSQ